MTGTSGALPLVSVSIPCYNAAATLAETLDSVLAQTYPAIEIIVVDDGSTDHVHEVVERYAKSVHVVRKENGGLASARNAGCLAAKGKYVALLDADDLCMPERIALQVAYMEQNPEVVLVSSDFSAFDRNGTVAESYLARYYTRVAETGIAGLYPRRGELSFADEKVTTHSGYAYYEMASGSFIHPPTVLFRRSILDQCGLFDERIPNCCDFDWFVRVSRFGEIGFINRSLLKYRLSEHQMSGVRNKLQIALDIVQVMEKNLAADPDLLRQSPALCRRQLGVAYLYAADRLAEDRPLAALSRLLQSARFGTWQLQSLKILLKALTPLRLLEWRRNRR